MYIILKFNKIKEWEFKKKCRSLPYFYTYLAKYISTNYYYNYTTALYVILSTFKKMVLYLYITFY